MLDETPDQLHHGGIGAEGQARARPFCDVSTGEFYAVPVRRREEPPARRAEPRGAARAAGRATRNACIPYSAQIPMLTPLPEERFHYAQARQGAHASTSTCRNIADLSVEGCRLGVCAAGALLAYLHGDPEKRLKTHPDPENLPAEPLHGARRRSRGARWS